MSDPRRVQQQPAYILHHRPFRDTSQILDVLTRDHGKIALIARGSRGRKSRLAGVLRPFLPLRVSWVARTDLGTLTGAEAAGAPAGMRGEALLSAFYVNELLLCFLHRHDPQSEVYALYAHTVSELCAARDVAGCLRNFELEFLGLLGYAVTLDKEAGTHAPVRAAYHYDYRPEQGPVRVARDVGRFVFRGSTLLAIAARQFDDADVLRAANRLLRKIVTHHLGGRELHSRKVLMEVHRGRIAPAEKRTIASE